MRSFIAIVLLASTVSAEEVILPLASGVLHGRERTTTISLANSATESATCRFEVPVLGFVFEQTVAARTTLVLDHVLHNATSAGIARLTCPSSVEVVARLQESIPGIGIFSGGRLFRPFSPSEAMRRGATRTLDAGNGLVLAEIAGAPIEVDLTWSSADGHPGSQRFRIAPHSFRLVDVRNADPMPVGSLRIQVSAGEGSLLIGRESLDPALDAVARPVLQRPASVPPVADKSARLLSVSSFKGAPFEEPMTGLVYMRDRWYDPRTGTFLTPDPVGYVDSPDLYRFAAADPVNNSDPTGLALYAFDGTSNDREQMGNVTNVAKLFDAYRGGVRTYLPGVGTDWYSILNGQIAGWGGLRRVKVMQKELQTNFGLNDRAIDVIGFSRGGALALSFANRVYREGVYDRLLKARIVPEIRFLGLFDTVGSFGMPGNNINLGHELSVPPNVKRARQAVALNEYRSSFPLTRLWDPNCGPNSQIQEQGFRGAHADIGGGYEDNDYLSRNALQWMWSEMKSAGIGMVPIDPAVGTIPPGATVVQHQSHESALYSSDWVRVQEARLTGSEPSRRTYFPPCKAQYP